MSTANVLYVLLEQRTNVTATRQLKKLAPVLLSMLKAGLTLFAVPCVTPRHPCASGTDGRRNEPS